MTSLTIATAGHVDHGKSRLIEALTGSDPDRLVEEKRRGMTIELGFAHVNVNVPVPGTDQSSAVVLSFIDVPGHSDLVRTMITGAAAAEAALCVIDVSEGIKPQTWEHLAVLELLGITDGVIALTKCDLVDELTIEKRRQEIVDAFAHSPVTWHAIVPTSAHNNSGIDALIQRLAEVALATQRRQITWSRPRLGVDRVFTIAGAGTVVTGTLEHGALSKGDELVIARTGQRVRVRGLHLHGHDVERIEPISRCAINLADCEVHHVERGDSLVAPNSWHLSNTFDVILQLTRNRLETPRPGGGYTMHLGTHRQEVTLRYLGTSSLQHSDSRLEHSDSRLAVRLRGAHQVPVTPGDRFILRSTGDDSTVGGGIIVDAAPRRRPSHVAIDLDFEQSTVEHMWEMQLDAHGWISVDEARRLTGHEVPARAGKFTAAQRLYDETVASLSQRLDHGDVALAELSEWERELIASLPDVSVAQGLARRGSIDFASHPLAQHIRDAGVTGPSTAAMDRSVIRHLVQAQLVWVHDDIAFHRDTLNAIVPTLERLMADSPHGFTVAQLRDALGITRKHAVPLVTCLDKAGITVRRGDLRVVRTTPT